MEKRKVKNKEEYFVFLLDVSACMEARNPGFSVADWMPVPCPDSYPCVVVTSDSYRDGLDLLFSIELVYMSDFLILN